MEMRLRPLREQVVVITGASSGIGLVTAKRAAASGARVVLAARNEPDLAAAVRAIRERGGRAIYHVTDVADARQVEDLGGAAVAEFGPIDSWINNAGVSVYGRCTDTPVADLRRQFDVNYWGQVHGMLTAVRLLRTRGGALINVASAAADSAIPFQGNYCATKHAIEAFTNTLRLELEEAGLPISVTLIKPGSMDTPLFEKARSFLGVEPRPIPPVYAPEVAVRAIVAATERPIREITAGGMSRLASLGDRLSPRLTNKYIKHKMFDSQRTAIPIRDDHADNLYEPVMSDGGERGHFDGRVHERSAYTQVVLHLKRTALLGTAATAAVLAARRAFVHRKTDADGSDTPAD